MIGGGGHQQDNRQRNQKNTGRMDNFRGPGSCSNDSVRTIASQKPHFHLCIGPHKGPANNPTPPQLARHRQTARAELYRRLDRSGAPVSWGLRLFNGHNEQQATILLPNPYLSPDADKVLKTPDWSRLDLWDLSGRGGSVCPSPTRLTARAAGSVTDKALDLNKEKRDATTRLCHPPSFEWRTD